MEGKILFVLLLYILNISVETQRVPNQESLQYLRNVDVSQREIAVQLSHHPELIYSDFMEHQLNSEIYPSVQCFKDVLQIIRALNTSEEQALRSKYTSHTHLFLG